MRCADPAVGLYDAAEVQWWWARPLSTDTFGQLFWFDDHARPVAAVILTAFGDQMQLDPIVMPDAAPEWIAHVMQRGLAHADAAGVESVTLEVDSADAVLRPLLLAHGFTAEADGGFAAVAVAADAVAPHPNALVHRPEMHLAGPLLVIGVGLISCLIWLARKGTFTAAYNTPVDMVGLYWHFVDIIWIFLFPLLYLIDRHLPK